MAADYYILYLQMAYMVQEVMIQIRDSDTSNRRSEQFVQNAVILMWKVGTEHVSSKDNLLEHAFDVLNFEQADFLLASLASVPGSRGIREPVCGM